MERKPDLERRPGSAHVVSIPPAQHQEAAVRLILAGEIGVGLDGELAAVATEVATVSAPVEIDARHVTFLDRCGVEFLANLANRLPSKPKLFPVTPTIEFLLEVTRTKELFELSDRQPEPAAAIGG